MGIDDLLHIFRATVTHTFTVFRLKILWSLLLLGKSLSISLRNVFAMFAGADPEGGFGDLSPLNFLEVKIILNV